MCCLFRDCTVMLYVFLFLLLQAPYLEIKKQMDKQDPLAHPLLQWFVLLFIHHTVYSTS